MLDPALVFKKFEINKSCIINLHMMQKKISTKKFTCERSDPTIKEVGGPQKIKHVGLKVSWEKILLPVIFQVEPTISMSQAL